jgi:hypothetical protein
MSPPPAAPNNTRLFPPNTWVDDLYRKVALHLVTVSLLCGGTVYAAGLFIALTLGFQATYLTTIPVYYGFFGISWVLGCIRWGVLRVPGMLDEVRICFKDEQRFVNLANQSMRALGSRAGAFRMSAGVFLVGLVGLVLWFFVFGQDTERRLFPDLWYQEPLAGKTFILLVFDIGCSLPLGTGLWLIYANALFLHSLSRLDVIPLPGVLIARLRRLTAFYLIAALTWFLGVALFGLLFFKHLDALAAFILSITAAFGLVLSLGPQLVFHRFIARASSEAAGEFARLFKLEFSGRIDHGNLPQVTSMLQASQAGQMWVINLKDVLLLIVGQLLPLFALVLREKLALPS